VKSAGKAGGLVAVAEISSWSISFLLADIVCRKCPVKLLGMESSGGDTLVAKFTGERASLEEVLDIYRSETELRELSCKSSILTFTESCLDAILFPPNLIHPLYNHREQFLPTDHTTTMQNSTEAIGILETVGLAASLQACDAMLKAANIRLVGKEKIGAAYVTIVIRGDVAAVAAALAAGSEAVGTLGKLVASQVIARPHEDLLRLLPYFGEEQTVLQPKIE
jgi:ethanolamine utilization protein EutM